MIDRARRDRFAEFLRHFAAGLLTNDDFNSGIDDILDDRRPVRQWEDKALWTIRSFVWNLDDDMRTYRLRGPDKLTGVAHDVVVRCIVLLYSDQEYEGPEVDFLGCGVSPLGCLLAILTLGLSLCIPNSTKRRTREQRAAIDWNLWPFPSAEALARAAAKPRLLTGAQKQGAVLHTEKRLPSGKNT